MILIFCIAVLSNFQGCTKMAVTGHLQKSGIAFTFDDFNINEWFRCLPLLDSFGVKGTFYISNYNKLNREEIDKLKFIKKCGHEIAFHTTNHFNMVKYVNNKGMDALIQNEILAGLSKMNADGFYPTTFAYPFGQHTQELDNTMLKYFRSVRALNGTNNYTKSLATTLNNTILYGLGIDESSKRPMSTILQLVSNAHDDNNCLVMVSHHTDMPGTKFITTQNTLREIIKKAVALDMRFYTVSEISR
ncbi:MAG: polysaccharide deacetylase family protein [Chitinophagaceae bacterium]|nr:polysaccharide deacetylase family protein [Chitinophagaceae bacterium]